MNAQTEERDRAQANAQAYLDGIKEMFEAYKALDEGEKEEVEIEGDTYTDAGELRDRAREDALSVEVRSG